MESGPQTRVAVKWQSSSQNGTATLLFPPSVTRVVPVGDTETPSYLWGHDSTADQEGKCDTEGFIASKTVLHVSRL